MNEAAWQLIIAILGCVCFAFYVSFRLQIIELEAQIKYLRNHRDQDKEAYATIIAELEAKLKRIKDALDD